MQWGGGRSFGTKQSDSMLCVVRCTLLERGLCSGHTPSTITKTVELTDACSMFVVSSSLDEAMRTSLQANTPPPTVATLRPVPFVPMRSHSTQPLLLSQSNASITGPMLVFRACLVHYSDGDGGLSADGLLLGLLVFFLS